MLRSVWPDHTAKIAARASGLSVRTIQGWLSERFTPSASALWRMAARNDQMRAELIRRLTEINDDSMAAGAQGVLPLVGGPMDQARHPRHDARDDLAAEG